MKFSDRMSAFDQTEAYQTRSLAFGDSPKFQQ